MRSIIIALLLAATPLAANDIPAILQTHAESLRGARAGVDDADNLWLWDRFTRTVTRISLEGKRTKSAALPKASSVDADARRGIALLTDGGQRVKIVSWHGAVLTEFVLTEPAGDIAWMKGSLIAVTPYFAAHRVAVWDTTSGRQVRTIGPALPISRGPGRHLARATLVRYNPWRDEVVALEATFGQVHVFSSEGALLRNARLPGETTPVNQWKPGNEDDSSIGTTVLWRYPALSVAPDGGVWIGSSNEERDGITLFHLTTDRTMRTISTTGPSCMSARAIVWHDLIVFFGDPQFEDRACAAGLEYAIARDNDSVVASQIGEAAKPRTRYVEPTENASVEAKLFGPYATPCCHKAVCPAHPKGWLLVDDCCTDTLICYWLCVYIPPAP
jgi:hypothetical protein